MKTFSHYRPHQPNSRIRFYAAIFIVALLLFIDLLSHGAVRGGVQSAAGAVHGAFERIASAMGESGFFSSRRSLAEENARLKDRVASLELSLAAGSAGREEAALLAAMAHLATSTRGFTARVISSPRTSPYGTFLIAAGASEHVAVGDAVLSDGGFLLGHITSIQSHTSVVQEVFAPGARVDVHISNAAAVLEGVGGGNARAELPRDLSVAVGDIAYAPSFAHPVGIVGSIASSSASAVQRLYVRTPANLAALRFVYVETLSR